MPETSLILRGRVRAVLGENIDTDIIYPGRYLNVTDREKTAEHLFELAYPDIRGQLQPGEFIVAAANFGCGSSREQAAAALKFAGAGTILAAGFARIFYRNAIELDLAAGRIANLTRGTEIAAAPLDPRAVELLQTGGLIPYLKRKYASAQGTRQ
jgi:3-isopropylmalate/(R)-2-methylmalate dehydratase small subunit